jgi:hypothetical protein
VAGRSQWWVAGHGGCRGERGGVEEVVEALADDVDVQILGLDKHDRGFD